MERGPSLNGADDQLQMPFDYVIVGSGAGGGPLAARLALAGRRVLVIEAGCDAALEPAGAPPSGDPAALREIYAVPGYHAAATEDPQVSWHFSVRHYADDRTQALDSKYVPGRDPATHSGAGKGGILYPRCASLGGCTSHHAMIIIRPNDEDWDHIARLTGDGSWRSENMQGYFPKIEKCLYYAVYKGVIGKLLGGLLRAVQVLAAVISPRHQLDTAGHGFKGWQPTSFIDPLVIAGIVKGDSTFLGVLRDVIWSALREKEAQSLLRRALSRLQIIQFFDPNVRSPGFEQRTHPSLISVGTDGKRRRGVRELLLDVAAQHPDRLVLLTGAHATRVLFETGREDAVARAVGVEVALGLHLYQASPLYKPGQPHSTAQFFARREVILCGGAFNTPQLLMLSGIGDAAHLREMGIDGLTGVDGLGVAPVVELPGVGSNLQDRYEVSVINEMRSDFTTLRAVSFVPGDANDKMRLQWLQDQTGLYSTNGGAVAMFLSSPGNPRTDPDLYVFGIPAAFRGYYWQWSRELFRKHKGGAQEQRNLWTWVLLKAYTNNNGGTVRLRSKDPLATPEINFHSFGEGLSSCDSDLQALCHGVREVRRVNSHIRALAGEVQPGHAVPDDSDALAEWVQHEAWGHHASGSCRMGADPWRADVHTLNDKGAVLDSEFRVHGVHGLRVVDASIFPQIPGYFIVTPVFMASEKAADTILGSSPEYPSMLEQVEAAAVRLRRDPRGDAGEREEARTLPEDAVGLALSGGGIRSATFCLGVLQAMAQQRKLHKVDFLSTVSGGGYAGGFLGRLFSRMGDEVIDKAGRVEDVLRSVGSAELWWLRRQANYINGAGRSDLETNFAVLFRNLLALHFSLALLMLFVFGTLAWIAGAGLAAPATVDPGLVLSPWWPLPPLVLAGAVVPLAFGYWLAPEPEGTAELPPLALLAWTALLAGAVAAVGVPGMSLWGGGAAAILLLGWLWQEALRWRAPDTGIGRATLVRSRLTRSLGVALYALAVSAAWVGLDSLARSAATPHMAPTLGSLVLAALLLLPMLRRPALAMARRLQPCTADRRRPIRLQLGAFALVGLVLFVPDLVVHLAFARGVQTGAWLVLTALAVSLVIGQAIRFSNRLSLLQSYTEKLVRTFLGASNDRRVHPCGAGNPVPVQVPDPEDDVWLHDYHPETQGGPLHLINVCVNESVDTLSGRQLREDYGLPMCVGPAGVSVGRRFHSTWLPRPKDLPADRALVRPVPVAPDPNAFHVLARSGAPDATVEQLRLGQWMAISGAALTPGSGRKTRLSAALLLGLLNLRLGYWWNSGIEPGKRPGRYPPGLWRRIKELPAQLFRAQATLLDECRAYFGGPSQRLWYLSDGGHFDNTGLYELVRRRLPFIIAVDAGQDLDYDLGDMAILTRQVRLDFGAELVWIDPTSARKNGRTGWAALDEVSEPGGKVPAWLRTMFNPDVVGPPATLRRKCTHCTALARIRYHGGARQHDSWLLLVRAVLLPDVPLDVRNYAATHDQFPNESTVDQFFDDDQWESYRRLGEHVGKSVFAGPAAPLFQPPPSQASRPTEHADEAPPA